MQKTYHTHNAPGNQIWTIGVELNMYSNNPLEAQFQFRWYLIAVHHYHMNMITAIFSINSYRWTGEFIRTFYHLRHDHSTRFEGSTSSKSYSVLEMSRPVIQNYNMWRVTISTTFDSLYTSSQFQCSITSILYYLVHAKWMTLWSNVTFRQKGQLKFAHGPW